MNRDFTPGSWFAWSDSFGNWNVGCKELTPGWEGPIASLALRSEDEANAHLIAAAPDIYGALVAFMEPAGDSVGEVRDRAMKAIRKASGEAA